MRATWKPHEKQGTLTKRSDLPSSVFAYPHERKEPMTNASHVRNAIARFDQVEDVSDDERALAFANIKKAAKHYEVEVSESDWSELSRPGTRAATARKRPAKKADTEKSAVRQTNARKKPAGGRKAPGRKKPGAAR